MQFLSNDPLRPKEPQGFAAEEMVRCETCLRANPPTRANCLYCAAPLPAAKRIIDQRAITLKPLDDAVAGYNCIQLPIDPNGDLSRDSHRLSAEQLSNAAQLLKLAPDAMQQIISTNSPIPVARTATREEAELVCRNLAPLGIKAIVLGDNTLGVSEKSAALHIRAMDIGDEEVTFKQIGGYEGVRILWSQIGLIVSGRLISKRSEAAEQKGRRGEREITEASEFFSDELVMDIYVASRSEGFRISANSFDFSSLPERSMIAAENFVLLRKLILTKATSAHHDDSYRSLLRTLDLVWPSAQRTGPGGWRRDRPGKYSVEAVTQSSNLNQFTRYSRLRWFLMAQPNIKDI